MEKNNKAKVCLVFAKDEKKTTIWNQVVELETIPVLLQNIGCKYHEV